MNTSVDKKTTLSTDVQGCSLAIAFGDLATASVILDTMSAQAMTAEHSHG